MAPLPPPPMSVVDNLQLEIDRDAAAVGSEPAAGERSERQRCLAAQKQRLLEAVVKTSDSTGYAARIASEAAEDEGYEIQIESAAARAAGNPTPALAALRLPPPNRLRSIRWRICFIGIDLPVTPPIGGRALTCGASRGPAHSPGESASDVCTAATAAGGTGGRPALPRGREAGVASAAPAWHLFRPSR